MTNKNISETTVYLSYSGSDYELSKRVEDFLQSLGCKVCKNFERTFNEESDYQNAMKEIKTNDVFIILLSTEAQRFHEFDTEVNLACYLEHLNTDFVFIPLMVEEYDYSWDNRLSKRKVIYAIEWSEDVETLILQALPDSSIVKSSLNSELLEEERCLISALQLLHEAHQKKYIEPFDAITDKLRSASENIDSISFDELKLEIEFELGSILSEYDNPVDATDHLKHATELADKFDDFDIQIQSLIKLGWAFHRTSKYDEAMKCYKHAQYLCAKHDHRYGNGAVLNNMGEVYRMVGDYDIAMCLYKDSIEVNGVSDLEALGATWNNIGIIHMNRGEFVEAQNCVRSSLIIFREDFEDAGESNALLTLGELQGLQGDYDKAIETLNNALEIKTRIGSKYGYGQNLLALGEIYRLKGDYDKAFAYFEGSFEMFESLSDKRGKCLYYYHRGLLSNDLNKVDDALECFYKSLEISLAINDKLTLARVNFQIALIYREKVNDYAKSLKYAEKAQVYTEQMRIIEDEKIKKLISKLKQ